MGHFRSSASLVFHRRFSFHLMAALSVVLVGRCQARSRRRRGLQGRLYCGRETTDAGLRQMMLFDFQTYSRDTAFPGSIKLTCGRRNRAAAPRSRLRRGGFGWTRPFFSTGISTLLELGSSCRLFISNVVPLASGVLHHRALDDDAGSDVLPEDDEKLSRQGDNGRLLPASAGDTLLEP